MSAIKIRVMSFRCCFSFSLHLSLEHRNAHIHCDNSLAMNTCYRFYTTYFIYSERIVNIVQHGIPYDLTQSTLVIVTVSTIGQNSSYVQLFGLYNIHTVLFSFMNEILWLLVVCIPMNIIGSVVKINGLLLLHFRELSSQRNCTYIRMIWIWLVCWCWLKCCWWILLQ